MGLLAVMGTIWTATYLFHVNNKISQIADVHRKYAYGLQIYYELLLSKEVDTRNFRHELKNQLVCLENMAKKDHAFHVLSYLSSLTDYFVSTTEPACQIGNLILDVLTAEYASKLEEDINLTVEGKVEKIGTIDPVDLCIIYANLLSNAVEALKRVQAEQKSLTVKLAQGNNHLEILVENTCDGKTIEKKGSVLITHKKDKKNHGLGLHNVHESVFRNRGKFTIDHTDNLFTARVVLPLAG